LSTGTSRQPSRILTFVLDRALDLVFAGKARRRIARQEDHSDAVLTRRRQVNLLLRQFVAEKPVRNLDQAACAIRQLRVPTHRAAVRQVLQHGQSLLDDRVRFPALDVSDEADTAGVAFVSGVVQALGGGRDRQVHG
jgi:hypothetical protein